ADGYLFWATGYGKGGLCTQFTSAGPQVAWTSKDMVCLQGGYLIENGFIYGNHERGLVCLDLGSGKKRWFDKGVGRCSITYADGMPYLFGETDGEVGLAPASPEGFRFTGRFRVEGEGPSWAH